MSSFVGFNVIFVCPLNTFSTRIKAFLCVTLHQLDVFLAVRDDIGSNAMYTCMEAYWNWEYYITTVSLWIWLFVLCCIFPSLERVKRPLQFLRESHAHLGPPVADYFYRYVQSLEAPNYADTCPRKLQQSRGKRKTSITYRLTIKPIWIGAGTN